MKDLSIGGIVMLNRTDKGDKEEEIVEPMEVDIYHILSFRVAFVCFVF